jgi:hypothetical protein
MMREKGLESRGVDEDAVRSRERRVRCVQDEWRGTRVSLYMRSVCERPSASYSSWPLVLLWERYGVSPS